MEKKKHKDYVSPAVRVINIEHDITFCFSGNHEGFAEEDWDEP